MSNPFHGDVLFRAVPTGDGRQFTGSARFAVGDLPLQVDTYDGTTRVAVGLIDSYADIDDRLSVAGTVDLPPGDYPCGVEVDRLEVLIPIEDPLDFFRQGVEYYTAGRLRRLAVYTGPDAESKPAWPGTHITVTEGAPNP